MPPFLKAVLWPLLCDWLDIIGSPHLDQPISDKYLCSPTLIAKELTIRILELHRSLTKIVKKLRPLSYQNMYYNMYSFPFNMYTPRSVRMYTHWHVQLGRFILHKVGFEHPLHSCRGSSQKCVLRKQASACRLYLKGFPGTPSVACFHWLSAVKLFDLWGTS